MARGKGALTLVAIIGLTGCASPYIYRHKPDPSPQAVKADWESCGAIAKAGAPNIAPGAVPGGGIGMAIGEAIRMKREIDECLAGRGYQLYEMTPTQRKAYDEIEARQKLDTYDKRRALRELHEFRLQLMAAPLDPAAKPVPVAAPAEAAAQPALQPKIR